MEVGIARTDTPDTVLPHQYGGLGVMHQVSSEQWHFADDLREHLRVPIGGHEHSEAG